jgi:chitin disaccharide deacetylase
MVLMKDSEGTAELAKGNECTRDYINFSQGFTAKKHSRVPSEYQFKRVRLLRRNKYLQVLYNPVSAKSISYLHQVQRQDFVRLLGGQPLHFEGHHHMHLCANVLLSNTIPPVRRLRRNFSFWPGKKSMVNRTYRSLVDR